MAGYRQARLSVNRPSRQAYNSQSKQKNYVSFQSGAKRHQFQATPNIDLIAQSLPAGEYFGFSMLAFLRGKSGGGVSDVPPSATASNNYQTHAVMNGSKIVNYNSKIQIRNRGAIGVYLDVYEVAVSFYDVLVWNTIFPTACPFTFDSTTTGPPDLRGGISPKTVTTTLVVKNTIKNYKFLQHYIKPRGTIFVTNEDGGNGGEVTINVNRIPPKCRRSQTGMLWALLFHNDADANGNETLTYDAINDVSFEEIPSDNRLPYID